MLERFPSIIAVGCGVGQSPLIAAAKSQGFFIVGIDIDPAVKSLDVEVKLSTWDTASVVAEMKNMFEVSKPQGLLCRSSGPAIRTAYELTKIFGLPGCGELITNTSLSKWCLYEKARVMKVPTIHTIKTNTTDNPAPQWQQIVVKPAEPQFGKKNVFYLQDSSLLQTVLQICCEESLDQNALIQPFILGHDVGAVAMTQAGKVLWTGLFEENNSFEDGRIRADSVKGVSRQLSQKTSQQIQTTIRSLVNNSESNGFVFFSFRVDQNETALLYEVNPGLCGDNIAEQLLPELFSGYNFFEAEVKLMTGMTPKIPSVM